jgi:subtilisin family serine protease
MIGAQYLILMILMSSMMIIGSDHTPGSNGQDLDDQYSPGEATLYPALDISTGAAKVRPSDLYHDVWDELGYTGKGITIAIIDTGVDEGHETFGDRWIAGVDITNPLDPRDGTANPDDRNGHGTRVASCLVGNGGPDGLYRGVIPDARLVEIKVANDLAGGFSTQQQLGDGIQWAIDHRSDDWGDEDPSNDGINVLSISYADSRSDDGSSELAHIVDDAVEAGIIVVVAIGNDGPDNDGFGPPSSSDLAITVGGIDDRNTVDRSDDITWDSSTKGPRADDGDNDPYDELKPEVVAPAVGITAALFSLTDQNGEGWDTQDGTSYATPHVSGIAALMLEANPALTQTEIDLIMRETAEPRGEPDFPDLSDVYNISYGFGIIDGYACVREAERLAAGGGPSSLGVSCSITSPDMDEVLSGAVTVSGTASTADPDDHPLDMVQVSFDGAQWFEANGTETWAYEWNTTEMGDGDYTISARAGAEDDWSALFEVTVTIDNIGDSGGGSDSESSDDNLIPMPSFVSFLVAVAIAMVIHRK